MARLNKEQIYDEQIAPLMNQVAAFCKHHRIAFVAAFSIPNDSDPTVTATVVNVEAEHAPPEPFVLALRELRPDVFTEPVFAIANA